jgi:integrase
MSKESRAARRVRVERGIYRQPNGKYVVCFMLEGRPRFRTVGFDLELAREQRRAFMRAAQFGVLAATPRLTFGMVAGWWIERFQRRVATGERRERTLELHRYHLDRHLLPILGLRLIREITVSDVALMLDQLRASGRAEKTLAGALGTLGTVMRFAVRNSWIQENPVEKLETHERPRPVRQPQRALGQEKIVRLLDACLPQYRPLLATGVFTGMRLSELLGLTWDDVDLVGGCIDVRAQLSRAGAGKPARRVAPKTASAFREIPLAPQLTGVLRAHRRGSAFKSGGDWVFATRNGTPLSQRNAQRTALAHAADAGLRDGPLPLRFHHLRHYVDGWVMRPSGLFPLVRALPAVILSAITRGGLVLVA